MPKPIICSFVPEAPKPTWAPAPETPPDGVRVQFELIKRLGMVSEFDWSKFGDAVDVNERLADMVNRNYFESLMAQKVALNPRQVDNWQQWLTRHFPSFASDASAPKRIRSFLSNAKRAGENFWDIMPFYAGQVDEALAKLGSSQVIKDAYEQFTNVLKVNGVDLSKRTVGEIWVDAIEVAQTERILRFTQAGENGRRVLQARYDKFINKLQGYGISEEGIEILMRPVNEVSKAYDELLVVAQNAGVAIDGIHDIGYFNRVLSADAKFRLGREQAEVFGAFLENPRLQIGAAMQKSRSTYDFIVEDELLLASAMGLVEARPKKLKNTIKVKQSQLDRLSDVKDNLKPRAELELERLAVQIKEYDDNIKLVKDALKQAEPGEVNRLTSELKTMQRGRDALGKEKRKLTGKVSRWKQELDRSGEVVTELEAARAELERITREASNSLNDVLTNEKKLLVELSKLPDETLDALVDSGVLSKLPMMTNDVYRYMVDRYKLPYKGIEELLLTDPVRAYNAATDQLKQLMGKTTMSQAMFKDAIEKGWGVTQAMKQANPEEYGRFVRLDQEVYKRFGITEIPGAQDILLHPMVADMYTAILEVSTDPGQLGTFAAVWRYVNSIFKKQVLTTTGFLGRQVFQLFVSSGLSGTNMAELIPAIAQYTRFKKIGLEAFDNTKKAYGGGRFTERELMVELMKRGAIDNIHKTAPIAGVIEQAAGETYSAWNPRNLNRAIGYWSSIAEGRGKFPRIKDGKVQWDVVEYGAELFERLTDEASGFVMMKGVYLENAAKLAHFKTTMKDGAANAIGQYLTSAKRFHFDDVDAAVKHSRDYFFDYSDMGLGDRFISRNIIPFWSYQSRNMPAVARHALRNPRQYMAYQRIYALMNQDARESGDDAPEGGFTPWQRGFGNIYIPHPSGNDNQWIHLPLTSVDPIADAIGTYEEGAKGLGQLLGLFSGDFQSDLDQVDPNNQTIPFIDALVANGYGSIKSMYAIASKKDPGMGRKLTQDDTGVTSILGVEIGGTHAPLIKFLIENTLPSVNNLNKANPMGVFGIKEQKDYQGNVTRTGKPSVLGVARSDSDNSKDGLNEQVPLIAAARLLGLTFNSVDTVKNMGYTEQELKSAVDAMKVYSKKLETKMKELSPDDPEYAKLQQTLLTTRAIAAEIELGRAKSEAWLQKRGQMTLSEKRKYEKEVEKMRLWLEQFRK